MATTGSCTQCKTTAELTAWTFDMPEVKNFDAFEERLCSTCVDDLDFLINPADNLQPPWLTPASAGTAGNTPNPTP